MVYTDEGGIGKGLLLLQTWRKKQEAHQDALREGRWEDAKRLSDEAAELRGQLYREVGNAIPVIVPDNAD